MRKLLALTCGVLAIAFTSSTGGAQEGGRHVSLRSTYLSTPVEGYHRLTLIGDLEAEAGRGHMELDPNACTLGAFGDTEVCTQIALTERTVTLHLTRTADPLELNRQLWIVVGTPLRGVLFLIMPDDPNGPHRLVYNSRSGARTVIAMEPLVYYEDVEEKVKQTAKMQASDRTCDELARKVDDVEADAQVRPGFVNDTYFLFLQGKKPRFNTWVEISPVHYPKRPEYWRIDVKECYYGDILLPAISAYDFNEEISNTMGTKGIELHWANGETQKIDRP